MSPTATAQKNGTATTETWEAKMARIAARKPIQRSIRLHDDEAYQNLEQARGRLDQVEKQIRDEALGLAMILDNLPDMTAAVQDAVNKSKPVIAARKAVDTAEAKVAKTDIVIHVRGLGSDLYEELLGQHPATAEQEKEGEMWNTATFPAALLAACCTEDMTYEQAHALITAVNVGEGSMIFQTCMAVNQGNRLSVGKD